MRAATLGSICCRLLHVATANAKGVSVPQALCSPFGSYPNPLGVTEEDRKSFHPVVQLPMIWSETTDEIGKQIQIQVPDVTVADLTRPNDQVFIVTEQDRIERAKAGPTPTTTSTTDPPVYTIGRYDEDRRGLYISELFKEEQASPRTVHVGIDIGGPVGTNVHAFTDGTVHSVGYNPALGDYGNVVVIQHTIPTSAQPVWALYGHLDASTRLLQVGQTVRTGQVIGRIGDIHENGGWNGPHVHFQLSTTAPPTHDMPGAVTLEDRTQALLQYPDPRYVLGMLY